MNNSDILINSFKPVKSQTLYSCKRRATLIFNVLKEFNENPTFESLDLITVKKSGIDNIFSPYNPHPFFAHKLQTYLKSKNKDPKEIINRSKLLDFLAFSDGYSSWENMHYHLSNTQENLLSFSFQYDETKCEELDGGWMVHTFYDNKNSANYSKELPNTSLTVYDRLPVGYSWGGIGSSVSDLALSILYFIDHSLTEYYDTLTKGLLCHLNEFAPEFIITKYEILQFIELAKSHPDATLRKQPITKSLEELQNEGFFDNAKPFYLKDFDA